MWDHRAVARPPLRPPVHEHMPWREPHAWEQRWAALTAVAVSIGLQLALAGPYVLHPRFVIPSVEAAMGLVLLTGEIPEVRRREVRLRPLSLALASVLAAANAISNVLLIREILTQPNLGPTNVLRAGAVVWLTNIVAFALWYWQLDRGGPYERSKATRTKPDFLFPQMSDPRLDRDWHPVFFDYLYLAATNATAFSPTDTLPLSRWAKALMMAQSMVALLTVSLVAARAVNILPVG